ncbi:MAG TPA: IS1634 family transposase, partial [Pseudomonadales bacterium]|nr:IS1634 family transposase [Pseudomonadales bacterium]
AGLNALRVLGEKVDVMFYDCTTLYFESFTEDELRQKGFSKDHKSQETQVLLALLVTSSGLPIGYRLYPGATWEGHTLSLALEDIAKYAKIAKVVVVADSGLFSKDNLVQLGEQPFIVAARLKRLPEHLVEEVTNLDRYRDLSAGTKYYETKYLGQRLIVTWSAKRAAKDAHEREKSIKKLIARYDGKPCKSLVSAGLGKCLRVLGEGKFELDEEKIAQASRWDGLHGMLTNVEDMRAEQALEQYQGLWQVEETFRLSKHDLSMRPMFHWTPRRIKAHVAICFMALTCIRHMEYQCALRYTRLSPEVIRQELAHVQVSILKDTKTQRHYGLPAKLGVHTRKLYGLLGKRISTTPFEITTR